MLPADFSSSLQLCIRKFASFASSFVLTVMPMRISLVLPIYRLLQIARGQVKNCYDCDGTVLVDYPCDPSANVGTVVLSPFKSWLTLFTIKVSACCGIGGRCVTNLFCMSVRGAQIVGSCTDKSWANDACPWALSLSLILQSFIFVADLETRARQINRSSEFWPFQVQSQYHLLSRQHHLSRSTESVLLRRQEGEKRDWFR